MGDSTAAARRMSLLAGLLVLPYSAETTALAQRLIQKAAFPPNALIDALHVAVAATHGIYVLSTWNCRHIADAFIRPRIESICIDAGFVSPYICTPFEFLEI